jgi:hypothetical protein
VEAEVVVPLARHLLHPDLEMLVDQAEVEILMVLDRVDLEILLQFLLLMVVLREMMEEMV